MAGKIKTLFSDKEKTEPLFPRTKTSAVSTDDGTGLDVLLEHVGYYDDSDGTGASVPVDADSLGGLPADNFASKDYVAVKIAEASMEGSDVDLSGYATKDELNAIDFPVDSVNGKTGAVVLSVSDVGAAPASHTTDKNNPHGVTAEQIGAQPELGFTPVQQGLAASGGNKIKLAWGNDGSGKYALLCYIDETHTGKIVTDNASFGGTTPIANGGTGATTAAQALVNLGAAPDGYGLGKDQGFTITSGGDCNYARENGWYYVTGALNAAHEYDHSMLVVTYGTGAIQQIAFMGSAFSSNTNIAVRKCSNGNWSAWEWINPPMSPGVEYRTTERWYNGSPVYTQIVNLGTTTEDCSFNISISGLIALVRAVPSLHNTYCTDWDIDAGVHATNQFYFCPAKTSTGVVIYARCGSNYTGKTLIAQIWYTK